MSHKKNVHIVTQRSDTAESTENDQSPTKLQLSGNSENRKKFSVIHYYHSYEGIIYTVLTSVCMILSSVFIKQMLYVSTEEPSVVRNIGLCVGSLPIAIYSVRDVFGVKSDGPIILARGLVGATGMYLQVMAVRYLPLAEAVIILSTTPAVTTVMARLYLKEPCVKVQYFALVLTLCGVLLSLRIPEILIRRKTLGLDKNYVKGLATAVGSILSLSLAYVLQSKMRHLHFSVAGFYIGLIGTVEMGTINFMASNFVSPICGWDQLSVLLIGILSFFGACSINHAIQVEAVGIVSILKTSMDLILAFVFQVTFFKSNPDVYNISGAFLVFLSISLIGIKKWLIALPEESKTKNRLKYFLV